MDALPWADRHSTSDSNPRSPSRHLAPIPLCSQERLTARQYASVAPVVLGIAITTITEAEFMLVGFVAAMISTAAQALQTVVSKHVLREREVRLLRALGSQQVR